MSSRQQEVSNKKEKSQASTTDYDKDKSDIEEKKKKAKPSSTKGKSDLEKSKRDLIIRAYQEDDNRVQEEEERITIDYMAKDYASFRNALLDLIPRRIPQWKDRSEADMGIMLAELFSYSADELSYFQDRVANEAFLRTARARSSVSSHLSLIDYRMQNGLSANAFIKVEVIKDSAKSAIVPAGFQIATYPERGRGRREGGGESAGVIIFETLQDQLVDVGYNRIKVHEINNNSNFSSIRNPSAILQGRGFPELKKGQYILLFEEAPIATEEEAAIEEVLPAAEDEDRRTGVIVRQAIVKLAEDSKIVSYKGNDNNTLITWEKGSEYPKIAYGRNAKVFCCANIIKASHGRTIRSEILKQKDQEVSKFLFTLKEAPLSFISDTSSPPPPSSSSLMQSHSTLKVWVDGELWEETDSLLKCGPLDQKFSISIDDNGYATILFGDGKFGLKPEDDSLIEAEYRVGNGSFGNVSKDTLTQFNLPQNQSALVEQVIESVTNPQPATGGVDIESMDDAKIAGPKSLKALERAVTLKDYEDLVKREFQNEITNARARFVNTGSWDTIFVSVDLKGENRKNISAIVDGSNLFDKIRKYLERIKMIGYEVQIEEAKYVPIEIRIKVYLQKYLDSEIVRDRIRNSLTNADNIVGDGAKGLFHPDNFTFGDPVYASKIYEVLKKTPEVKYGVITTFRKRRNSEIVNGKNVVKPSSPSSSSSPSHLTSEINVDYSRDEETKSNLDLGYIPINEDEIITIDSDSSHPENGVLFLDFIGDNETKDSDDDVVVASPNYSLYDENLAW